MRNSRQCGNIHGMHLNLRVAFFQSHQKREKPCRLYVHLDITFAGRLRKYYGATTTTDQLDVQRMDIAR